MPCGIYKIVSVQTNEAYIGAAAGKRGFEDAIHRHQRALAKGIHPNQKLQGIWNQFGEDSLRFTVVEYCDPEWCVEVKRFWMSNLRPALNAGRAISDETRAKMRERAVGNKRALGYRHTEESRKKMSDAHRGKRLSAEHRAKISVSRIGLRVHRKSAETRKSWNPRVILDETRQKLREARTRQIFPPRSIAWRKKLSLRNLGNKYNLGKKRSKEAIEKNRLAHLGKPKLYMRGSNHPNWRGGISPERATFGVSAEWKTARAATLKRDNRRCQRCSAGKNIHIHHICSFSVRELRTETSNLVALCENCHHWVHSKKNAGGEFLALPIPYMGAA